MRAARSTGRAAGSRSVRIPTGASGRLTLKPPVRIGSSLAPLRSAIAFGSRSRKRTGEWSSSPKRRVRHRCIFAARVLPL